MDADSRRKRISATNSRKNFSNFDEIIHCNASLKTRKIIISTKIINPTKMFSSHIVFFPLFFIMAFCLNTATMMQIIVEHPQNTSARLGDTVVLRCRVENQKGTLQWVKNGFGLGTARDLPLFERYNMVGKLNLGEYHLQIRNVSIEDEDVYECQLSPTDNDPIQISKPAVLRVFAEPSLPELVGIEPMQTASGSKLSSTTSSPSPPIIMTVEDASVTLSCRSARGRPAARILWAITADARAYNIISYITPTKKSDNNKKDAMADENTMSTRHRNVRHSQKIRAHSTVRSLEKSHYIGLIVETADMDEDGFATITSNITFSPTKAENGKYLACIAMHETFANPKSNLDSNKNTTTKSTAIALDISYRPKIRVEVDERDSSVKEDGRIVFRCYADARPAHDVHIKWKWSGDANRLAILDQHSAIISGLKLKDNEAHITCTATNSIGTESISLKINVPYGPRFISKNQTQLLRRGDTVTFECAALGNPIPEIRWYRADSPDFIATGINYTISNIQEADAGDYRCVATVDGFEPKTLFHRLDLKGPPIIYLNSEPIEEENGVITLRCEIQTKVFPLKIVWLFDQRALIDTDIPRSALSGSLLETTKTTSDKRVRLTNLARDYGIESRLTLSQFDYSQTDSQGIYRCAAHNDYGSAHDERNIYQRTVWQKFVDLLNSIPSSYRIAIPIGTLCLAVSILLACCMFCANRRQSEKFKRSCYLQRRCCCCCCFGYATDSKSSNYSHNNSGDVIVKCEAIDGTQFYPELYGSPPIDHSDIVYTKDYVSIPQSNPDLDYLPPSAMGYGDYPAQNTDNSSLYQSNTGTHHTFMSMTGEYDSNRQIYDDGASFSPANVHSSDSTDLTNGYYGGIYYPTGILPSSHCNNNGIGAQPLETLMEVTTPETDGGSGHIANGGFNENYGNSTLQRQKKQLQERPVSRISTHV